MSKGLILSKAEIRRAVRQKLLALSVDDYRRGSDIICQKIIESVAWRNASAVCLYYPLGREPDIKPLFQVALREGKELLLPRFNERKGDYEPVIVRDSGHDLQPGRYGILEPKQVDNLEPAHETYDFILVPGLGFSLNGCRLGRGSGYFDRLLARTNAGKCGVAFECQILSEIPKEPHDIHMNFMVTPARFTKCEL